MENEREHDDLEPRMHGDGADMEPAGDTEPRMHGDGADEERRRKRRRVMHGDGADETPEPEPRMTGSGAVDPGADPDSPDDD
jgi:hypothetical protein